MALSNATVQQLQATLDAVDEFYVRRLAEIDRDVRNLREYGASITDLGSQTTESATDEALSILDRVLA